MLVITRRPGEWIDLLSASENAAVRVGTITFRTATLHIGAVTVTLILDQAASVRVGGELVTLMLVRGGTEQVRIGVTAPQSVAILRRELAVTA
jgi:sRNA-binding carbon storage regulator CsrA